MENVTVQPVTPELAKNTKQNKKMRGASLVEYALLVALISVVAIIAIRTLGQKVSTQFSNIARQL